MEESSWRRRTPVPEVVVAEEEKAGGEAKEEGVESIAIGETTEGGMVMLNQSLKGVEVRIQARQKMQDEVVAPVVVVHEVEKVEEKVRFVSSFASCRNFRRVTDPCLFSFSFLLLHSSLPYQQSSSKSRNSSRQRSTWLVPAPTPPLVHRSRRSNSPKDPTLVSTEIDPLPSEPSLRSSSNLSFGSW